MQNNIGRLMNKFIIAFILLVLTIIPSYAASTNFSNALSQNSSKPMIVLIYAPWASGYQSSINAFRKAQDKLNNDYNFVEVDITKPEAASYNSKFPIYTNLPNIMLIRNNARISKFLDYNCSRDTSCIIQKANLFIYK